MPGSTDVDVDGVDVNDVQHARACIQVVRLWLSSILFNFNFSFRPSI